jgi:predicted unusual protein kinase regulating ubiquinone biosynthesis (AarF/ABC1/UbiB family)
MAKKTLDKIKTSLTARSLSIAKLGINFGAQAAGRGIAQIFESKEVGDSKWKSMLLEQAQSFSSEIGELKGSLMKAGQLLSMYGEHFFPPEINSFLKTLQQDSPAVNWQQIKKVLENELSPEQLSDLEIQEVSVGSASIGQVHSAIIKSVNKKIALKVQYPGVEKAIDTDLLALKTFIGLTKLLPKDINLTPVFDEIRSMLVQETDYRAEAVWTKKYAALVGNDPRFVVPKIYDEFCTNHIIASSFEHGLRIDDPLIQSLAQKRRDQLAENFLDLYFKELFLWCVVQTDPHAGNYKIRLNPSGHDQILLFDFGATKQYEEKFMRAYQQMIKSSVLRNREDFMSAATELNFIRKDDDPKLLSLFEEFCMMITEPFETDEYDWKNTDLPQRTTKKVMEIIKGFTWRTPPRELLFLDRKTGGVFIILRTLGAKVSGRRIMQRYFNQ